MEGVRILLGRDPAMTAAQIVENLKAEFDIDMNQGTAQSYRYTVLKKMNGRKGGRRKKRSRNKQVEAAAAPIAVAAEPTTDYEGGLDDLLRAARTLGWRRVKEITDQVIEAPA
jgi:hypothetical protein